MRALEDFAFRLEFFHTDKSCIYLFACQGLGSYTPRTNCVRPESRLNARLELASETLRTYKQVPSIDLCGRGAS